jgi:hypothetical protein
MGSISHNNISDVLDQIWVVIGKETGADCALSVFVEAMIELVVVLEAVCSPLLIGI